MSSTAPAAVAPETDAIARGERRRAKLERLSDIGMELAEEIRERNVKTPYHPEPKHDPARAFAAVSRAVRLTIVLEAKVDAEIVALRNGEAMSSPNSVRAKPRGAAARETNDVETARESRDCENLVDREADDFGFVTSDLAQSSLPRSGEGGRAASGREPGGGWARPSESPEASETSETPEVENFQHREIPPPRSRPEGGSRPSPLRGREDETFRSGP